VLSYLHQRFIIKIQVFSCLHDIKSHLSKAAKDESNSSMAKEITDSLRLFHLNLADLTKSSAQSLETISDTLASKQRGLVQCFNQQIRDSLEASEKSSGETMKIQFRDFNDMFSDQVTSLIQNLEIKFNCM
jgi:hypothetical protein